MARETKVGLLVGLCFVLLIGILISDQLSTIHQQQPADIGVLRRPAPERAATSMDAAADGQRDSQPIPMPGETGPSLHPEPGDSRQVGLLLQNTQVVGQQQDLAQTDERHSDVRPLDDTGSLQRQPVVVRQSQTSGTPIVTPKRHQVAEGEYLTEIARLYYGDSNAWRRIRDANPQVISEEGNVRAGAMLVIPPAPQREPAGSPSRTFALEGTGLFERVSPQPAPLGHVGTPAPSRTIKVESGDNLSQLAQRHLGSSARWRELLAANSDQLDRDTDLRAGMELKLPSGSSSSAVASREPTRRSAPAPYVVQPGDSLSKIAQVKLGDKEQWQSIYNLNKAKIKDPANIQVGVVLTMP